MKNNNIINAYQWLDALVSKLGSYGLLTIEEEQQADEYLIILESSLDTPYMQYIKEFNRISGKKFLPEKESRRLFYSNPANSLHEKIVAVKKATASAWMQENMHLLSPKYMLKKENVIKFLNYSEKGKEIQNQENNQQDETRYTSAIDI